MSQKDHNLRIQTPWHEFSISHWHTLRKNVFQLVSRRTRTISILVARVRPLVTLFEKSLLYEPYRVSQIISFGERKTEIETSSRETILRDENWVRQCSHRQDHSTTSKLSCRTWKPRCCRKQWINNTHTRLNNKASTINLNLIWLHTLTAGVGHLRKQVLKCHQ